MVGAMVLGKPVDIELRNLFEDKQVIQVKQEVCRRLAEV